MKYYGCTNVFVKNRHKKYWEKFREKTPRKNFRLDVLSISAARVGAAPYYGRLQIYLSVQVKF